MSNTAIIVIVLVILVMAFMMYNNSQNTKSSNEQMMWMMQNQNNQQATNLWGSTGNWAGIIDSFGGLFGGAGDGEVYVGEIPDDVVRINSSAYSTGAPFPATEGFNNLRDMVEFGEGTQLNMV